MSIAALFTIARARKQPKCPLTEEWIKKMWYICIYSRIILSHKRSKIVPSAGMWIEPVDCQAE